MRLKMIWAVLTALVALTSGLATGPAASASGGRSVLVLGDSLSVGDDQFGKLATKLTDAGFGSVEIDAQVGRSTRLGVKKLMGRDGVPDVVIVNLGTNDVALGRSAKSFRSYVEQVRDYVGSKRLVVWVDLTIARNDDDVALAAEYNQVLADVAASSTNFVVARWSGRQSDEMVAHDKVHLSPDGYRKRATFLAEVSYFFSTLQFSKAKARKA